MSYRIADGGIGMKVPPLSNIRRQLRFEGSKPASRYASCPPSLGVKRPVGIIRSAYQLLTGIIGITGLTGCFHTGALKNMTEGEMKERAKIRLEQSAVKNPWPSNTKVYASVIQEANAWMIIPWNTLYTDQLMMILNRPDIKTFDEAHHLLETQGVNTGMPGEYFYLHNEPPFKQSLNGTTTPSPQVPVSSTGQSTGWNKAEQKPRFMLLISGPGNPGPTKDLEELTFSFDTAQFQSSMQAFYQMPQDNFMELTQPKIKDLEKGMKWLQEMQRKHPDAEAMVYIIAHGQATGYSTRINPQGKANGYLVLNESQFLKESKLKALFNQYLTQYKHVALVMGPCHSGAWIAHNKSGTHPMQATTRMAAEPALAP